MENSHRRARAKERFPSFRSSAGQVVQTGQTLAVID